MGPHSESRPPGMRRDPEERRVTIAQAAIGLALERLQDEHGLTTAQMLQAVNTWQAGALKWMLRPGRDAAARAEEEARLAAEPKGVRDVVEGRRDE